MRLLRLYVGNYRVLRDLELHFGWPTDELEEPTTDTSYALDFIVGVNGSGKSTVLRLLSELVQLLERQAPIPFPFEIEYEVQTDGTIRTVRLSNYMGEMDEEGIPQAAPTLEISVDDEMREQLTDDLLPPLVVAFTTGSEAEWERVAKMEVPDGSDPSAIMELSEFEKVIRESPGKPSRIVEDEWREISRHFLFFRAQHLPIITLCGLLVNLAEEAESEAQRLYQVLQEARIGALRGFSLKFRLNEGLVALAERDEIRRLAKVATRALKCGADHLLVFNLTIDEHTLAKRILEEFSGGLALFKFLARLATPINNEPSILQEVNLFFERSKAHAEENRDASREHPPLHLLEWFSDGEQSFLGRMCLLSLLGASEALILLDEPEVHYNDYWKRHMVYLLDGVLQGHHSHVLIASHSSIILSDAVSDDIVILKRDETYTSHAYNPPMQTLAADPSEIMVNVFETKHPAGKQGIARIKKVLDDQQLSPRERRAKLNKLLEQVGPGYWSYRIRRELLALEQG